MISNSRPFFFRLLCLFLACLILANALIIPVRASVVGFLGFTVRSLIASLIRACGVYVADGIQDSLSDGLSVWESLVDYIAACVPAEYLYINAAGEKFIEVIMRDGLYYADRNLVEWVIDMLTSMGEDSSGDPFIPVGFGFPTMEQWQVNQINSILSDCESLYNRYYSAYTRELPYCTYIDFYASSASLYGSPLVIFSELPCDSRYNPNSGVLHVEVPAGFGIMLWTDSAGGNGSYRSSSSSAYTFNMNVDGATILDYEAEVTVQAHGGFGGSFDSIAVEYDTPTINNSWSAAAVTVSNSKGASVVGVPVSVPSDDTEDTAVAPWGDVTSGTDAGSGSVSIPGTGTDTGTEVVPDSDTSTQTGFWATVVSWFKTIWQTLKDILSAILSLAAAIAQPIVQAIADVIAAIKALVPEPPSFDEFQIPSLQSFFPFCIPFDLLDMMRALNASPVAPSFTFACPLPGGDVYYVNIDLSAWNGVASTIRSVTMAIYVVVLANSTRKFIKW